VKKAQIVFGFAKCLESARNVTMQAIKTSTLQTRYSIEEKHYVTEA